MTETVKKKVEALIQKAQQGEIKKWPRRTSSVSSLHAIIRTPEQARRFMKNLNEAQQTSKTK